MSAEFPTAADIAQVERERDNMQRRWVESVKGKSAEKAATDLHSEGRGEALLVWIDTNGEFRAQRISREASTLREFVPSYLQRNHT